MHKIHLRPKEGAEDKVLSGSNTELLIDGKPAKYVQKVEFSVDSKSIAVTKVSYFPNMEIEGESKVGFFPILTIDKTIENTLGKAWIAENYDIYKEDKEYTMLKRKEN